MCTRGAAQLRRSPAPPNPAQPSPAQPSQRLPVGSSQMAGQRKSPRGMRARTSTLPYFQLPKGDSLVRTRALVKGWVQVHEPSLLLVQPWGQVEVGREGERKVCACVCE